MFKSLLKKKSIQNQSYPSELNEIEREIAQSNGDLNEIKSFRDKYLRELAVENEQNNNNNNNNNITNENNIHHHNANKYNLNELEIAYNLLYVRDNILLFNKTFFLFSSLILSFDLSLLYIC